MKHVIRHRTALVLLAPLLVMGLLWWTDPDPGAASTRIWLLGLLTFFVALGITHWVRKAYFDYGDASDLRLIMNKANESPVGAGLVFIGIMIFLSTVLLALSGRAHAQDVRTYIPPAAMKHLGSLAAEQRAHWPSHPSPALLAALVEHESCISLKHSRCWNPSSRLKSAREEGAGFGQITRAYRADGSLRFDALQEMRDRHPALADWSWDNVYQRPDLQLRALVLMSRDNFRHFKRLGLEDGPALAFGDAGYNGGVGGVQQERRACGLKAGCDPRRWFGHVELVCLKSRVALYGGRSACDINRHHVHDVLEVRVGKYMGLL